MMRSRHDAKSRETAARAFKANQAEAGKAVNGSKDAGASALKAGPEAVAKAPEQAAVASNEKVHKAFPQAAGTFNEMSGFQKANLEALAAAGMIAAKGVESLSGELLAFNRKAIEDSLANAKRLFDCKTIPELSAVQADLARASFEQMIAHGTRITDLAVKLATEMAAPLRDRAGDAVGKLGKPFGA